MSDVISLEQKRVMKDLKELLADIRQLTIRMAISSTPSEFEQELTAKTVLASIISAKAEEIGVPEQDIIDLMNSELGV